MSEPVAQQTTTTPTPAPSDPEVKPGTGMPPMTEADVKALAIKNDRALADVGDDPFMSVAAFAHWRNVALAFANSQWVPKHLQGRPDDCLIAINLAKRMGEDPLMVMQNTHAIGGKPSFMTAFMVARCNTKARLKSRIRWRHEELEPKTLKTGNDYEMPNIRVTAYAIDEHGEVCETSVTTAMAIAEGWPSNKKYKSMPEHMLEWRAAAFLIRKYWPEVLMGMHTVEELETMPVTTMGASPAQVTAGDVFAGRTIDITPDRPAGSSPQTAPETPPPGADSEASSPQTASDSPPAAAAAAAPLEREREPGEDDDREEPAGAKPKGQANLLR